MTNSALPHTRSLGRYQLLFMLGQGGMGEVHLAKLTGAAGFEKLCIVKTILPQMQADPQFVERFHHEARVLTHLNHSNIAQVYDMGQVEGTLYMAIEYVPGVDLSRVVSRVKRSEAIFPIPIALYLGQQINEALGYAHRKTGPDGTPLGIVHRDVSPQNVMVSYEGEVKVIDFGLAKSAVRSQHTMPQTVMGKLGYMSPEQAMAKPVDHRSDIFSAGIMLWEILAGRPLYGGGTMGEMVAQMAYPNIPSLRSIRPEISATLDQIVMRALQVDPAARYSRADEFARALNELAVRESLTVGSEEVGNYVRAMCPEEFAAERQLQSKLSVLRKKGVTADEPATEPSHEQVEGTFLRPSQPALATAEQMTPAQRALSVAQAVETVDPNPGRGRTVVQQRPPGSAPLKGGTVIQAQPPRGGTMVQPHAPAPEQEEPSAPIVLPRSNTPIIAVGAVLLLAAAGGAAWYLTRPTPIVEVEPAVAVVKPPPAHEDPVVPDAGAEAPTPSEGKNPTAETPAEAPASLGMVDVVGTPVAARAEADEAVILLSSGQKAPFQEGDAVLLVSLPEEGAKRVPYYARGAVIDVKPTLVKVAFNEGQAPAGLKLYVMRAKESAKAPVTVAKRPPPKDPAIGETKDPVIAKNDPPPAHKDPVVVKPPVTPTKVEPAHVEAPPEPVKKAAISGAIGVSAPGPGGNQLVRVQNTSALPLTNCTIRLSTNRTAPLSFVGANAEVRLRYADFKADARPADPNFAQGWSAVYCHEGTGYFYTTFQRH